MGGNELKETGSEEYIAPSENEEWNYHNSPEEGGCKTSWQLGIEAQDWTKSKRRREARGSGREELSRWCSIRLSRWWWWYEPNSSAGLRWDRGAVQAIDDGVAGTNFENSALVYVLRGRNRRNLLIHWWNVSKEELQETEHYASGASYTENKW